MACPRGRATGDAGRSRPLAISRTILFAAVAGAAGSTSLLAQNAATWVGGNLSPHAVVVHDGRGVIAWPDQTGAFSDPRNWTPSTNYPTGGGAASIGLPLTPAAPERLAGVNLVIDIPNFSLGSIVFDNPRAVDLIEWFPSLHASLWTGAAGLTIESGQFTPEPASRSSIGYFGNSIGIPIRGNGAVTVRGPAPVAFTRSNFFGGDLNVAGTLAISEVFGEPLGDARFGSGATLRLDGGTLRILRSSTGPTRVFSRAMELTPAGGTLTLGGNSVGFAWAAPIRGSGPLRVERGRLDLRDDNPLTGAILVDAGSLAITGRIAAVPTIECSGTIELNHSQSAANVDRVGDGARMTLRGGALNLTGGSSPYVETIGQVVAGGAVSTITMNPGTANATLAISQLSREHGGGVLFRAPALGAPTSRILIANAADLLVGAGAPAGTTRQSIIPFAWAAQNPSPASVYGAGTGSLVTHDANGVRMLDLATEYVSNLATATASDNVRVKQSQTAPAAGVAVNAMVLGSSNGVPTDPVSIVSGGTINVVSGAILNTHAGNSITAPLQFGARQAVLIAATNASASTSPSAALTIAGGIHGTGGLARLGPGNIHFTAASTYSGMTTLGGGRSIIFDDILPFTPGPFGASNDPIVLVGGGVTPGNSFATMLLNGQGGGSLNIARPIRVEGRSSATFGTGTITGGGVMIGGAASSAVTNFYAPILLASPDVSLGVVDGTVNLFGPIRGAGGFRLTNASQATIHSSNPQWTGEIELAPDRTPVVLRVTAHGGLGTGRIYLAGRPTLIGTLAGVEIANPVVFDAGDVDSNTTLGQSLTFTGPIDLGGNIGQPLIVPAGGNITFAGPVQAGSFRLLARAVDASVGAGGTPTGGTLTLAGVNPLAARILLGAAPVGTAPVPGGVLRITHGLALGTAGVQLDADGSTLQLDGSSSNLLIPSSNVFLRGAGVGGLGALHNAAGANRLVGNIALLADATIRVDAGSSLAVAGNLADLSVSAGAVGQARLTVAGAGVLRLPRIARFDLDAGGYNAADSAVARLEIQSGTVRVEDRPGANRPDQTSVVRELAVGSGGRLDLGDSALVVDYDSAGPFSGSPIAVVRGLIASGYAAGAWNGPGIASSAASLNGRTGLAYGEATQWPEFLSAGFAGRPVDATSVLVSYAVLGDANLSGRVDLADFAVLAGRFNTPGTWADGDFSYDGNVGIFDFARLAQNFNQPLETGEGRTIPEPAGALLLALGLAFRRRSRR